MEEAPDLLDKVVEPVLGPLQRQVRELAMFVYVGRGFSRRQAQGLAERLTGALERALQEPRTKGPPARPSVEYGHPRRTFDQWLQEKSLNLQGTAGLKLIIVLDLDGAALAPLIRDSATVNRLLHLTKVLPVLPDSVWGQDRVGRDVIDALGPNRLPWSWPLSYHDGSVRELSQCPALPQATRCIGALCAWAWRQVAARGAASLLLPLPPGPVTGRPGGTVRFVTR